MSLNGLDAAPVSDAYYAAIVEVGGWFLLKYTNRDSVELLGKGKGGVHEARNELLKYEDKSPLYGLIIYRRRKVLIKFIPNGTSRLLQARTAVHFQAVAERYAPYETLLEISHPDELSDTSLASSFPLHTASPALSSTRLDEISEDAEDGGSASSAKVPARDNSAKFGTARYKTERRVDQLMRAQQGRPASPLRGESAPNLSTSPSGGLKPSISQFLVREDSGTRSITSLTPSATPIPDYAGSTADSETTAAKETDTIPSTVEPDKQDTLDVNRDVDLTPIEPVTSINTPSIREPSTERLPQPASRPVSIAGSERSSNVPQVAEQKSIPDRPKSNIEEPFDFGYLEPKPKVKLGPRPVNSAERPRKSGQMGTSLLPAGYLAKKQEQQRPKSTGPGGYVQSQMLVGLSTLPTPPPIPNIPEYSPRPISRGSVKSMPSQKSTSMTPEKLRLMKAVELRKRQMRKSNPQVRTPALTDHVPEVPQVPNDMTTERSETSGSSRPAVSVPQPYKPDSGIDLEHTHRVADERHNNLETLGLGIENPDKAPQEPPGLLSESIIPSNSTLQHPGTTPNAEVDLTPAEATTGEQQVSGAEDSPEISNHVTMPGASQIVVLEPASVIEPSHNEPRAEQTALTSTVAMPGGANVTDQNIDESTFSTSLENLITDVPAIVTTASSRPQTAANGANTPHERSPSPFESTAPSSMENSGILAIETDMSDLAKRRRGLIEPLHIDVETRRNSDEESLLDNDLLEELQSATFHDAKEMVVSKSPGPSTPFFPPHLGGAGRSVSHDSTNSQSRSPIKEVRISNGMSQEEGTDSLEVSQELTPQPQSGISSSSVSPVERHSPVASLKRNVSSGITKRIQALNELSNKEASTVPVHIPSRAMSPDAPSVFLPKDRRPSLRSPHTRSGSAYRLRPSADRAGSFPNGSQQAEIPHVWSTSQDVTSNRDSVSVKARIVRPPTAGSIEKPIDSPNDLHESQIEINHTRGIPTPTSVSQAFLPPMPAIPANPPSPDHRSTQSLRRKSFGRSRASTPGPVPANDEVRSGTASIVSTEEQSSSRTSRFFKRMSNFGSTSSKRRSVANAPILPSVASPAQNDTSASRAASVATNITSTTTPDRDTPPAVQVGDLNVQFPDTLLWKRRWLSLDDSGHLHLSPPTSHSHSQSQHGKKFHLSDFKAPFMPDLDRQELPHSICLEFLHGRPTEDDSQGGTLQLACEDAMGQRQVLRLLGGYWKSWAA